MAKMIRKMSSEKIFAMPSAKHNIIARIPNLPGTRRQLLYSFYAFSHPYVYPIRLQR